ncbi:MAG TPA: histone deacetylase family protein [Methylotenera sp.]|nr:histone deacetylase family protein [Methylotenera sp.]HPV44635.1 histone deacetylase family protein [Methylotenera sp.]
MTNTAFISHPDTLLHVMDGSHPESPARITAIKNAVNASDLKEKLQLYEAPAATKAQLQRVHSTDYVDYIHSIAPKAGLVRLDGDTAMGPMSLSAALHASGAVVLATDLVITGKAKNAFCCVRPPGHHAGRANSAGFCIFNHIAVGVAHAMSQYPIKRAAIIDFDVHHGDGTEDIFSSNPNVMLCSTFQHPFYPFSGAETRSKNMINVPLAAKTRREDFREAVITEFAPALDDFKPEIMFVSAGFDAHLNDPLADLTLIEEDYVWITEFIKEFAAKYAKNRIISSLEGGYHLPSLAQSAWAHINCLAKNG